MTVTRPECAGHYEPGDRQCDGHSDLAEPACKYRERCQLLISLGGGKHKMGERDPENNAHILMLFDEDDLDEQVTRTIERAKRPVHKPAHKPARRIRRAQKRIRAEKDAYEAAQRADRGDPNPTPRDAVKTNGRPVASILAVRVGRPTPVKFQAPRPVKLYGYTLPILDAIADRFADELDSRRVPETDAHAQVGDVYVHYTRSVRGQRTVLFRCIREHKTKNHRICSVWLRRGDPWVDLTLHVSRDRILDTMNLRPPRGLNVFVPGTIRFNEEIRVEGVTPDLVKDTTAWLARVYLADLIPMRRVKVKK